MYKRAQLYMESVPLQDIAADVGTPVYCYSSRQLKENFMSWKKTLARVAGLKGFTICYAVKANSNLAILRLLQSYGAGADIVSGGELLRALKAGIPSERIVYSGVGKSISELARAVELGLLQVNVESEQELHQLSVIAAGQRRAIRIALRINPDVDAKTHHKITTGRKENKFGIDMRHAIELYDQARKLPGIEVSGVAVHIGSQLLSLTPYRQAYKRVAGFVKELRSRGHHISTVDVGGGLGVRYQDENPPSVNDYAELLRETILPLQVHLIVEPGRAIVADAGVLLTQVLNVKRAEHKTFVILDAAMNDLLRPALYEAYHEVMPVFKAHRRKSVCDIVGPVCETGDTFHIQKKMPVLATGDLVSIMTAGAYGAAMASTYNTRALIPEVLIRGKTFDIIRQRQSFEQLIENEAIPEWLV